MAQLLNTDVLLVNRADATYQMTFAELQQSVTDKLRNGITLSGDPLPTFENTDLFLVNRGDITYKLTFAELKDSIFIGSAPVLTNVSLVENNPGVSPRFTSQAFTASSNLSVDGIPQSEKTIDAFVEGAILEDVQFNEPLESYVLIEDMWKTTSASQELFWYSVTYGDGKFVAVGEGGSTNVMHSPDGISWDSAVAAEPNQWLSVTYGIGNDGVGRFVAVAQTGTNRAMYSTDGINWTAAFVPSQNKWSSVAYGDGMFVAVSYMGSEAGTGQSSSPSMYSYNGMDWTVVNVVETTEWASVIYGDDKFVAVSQGGTYQVMYSTNGIAWTGVVVPEAAIWHGITYGNGKFVAVAASGTNRVMHSPDGINWTVASATEPNDWTEITYGNGTYVAVALSGINRIMYSTDAINWTPGTVAEENNWYDVTYGAGKFVAVSYDGINRVMYSDIRALLTFATGTDMTALAADDVINQGDTSGTVNSITDTTVNVSTIEGAWVDEANGGANVIGPAKKIQVDGTKKYLDFDSNGNVSSLLDTPQSPAYITTDINPGLTLTFPATFPSGLTPDEELGDGTTLTVTVKAENDAGTSGPLSATVQPEGDPPIDYSYLTGLTTLWSGSNDTKSITTGHDYTTNEALVWIKKRGPDGNKHVLTDTLRGAKQVLSSNASTPESNEISTLTSFEDGYFDVGPSGSTNETGFNYVGWSFAKTEKYFDVVEYSGQSPVQNVAHSLASDVGMIIIKKVTGTDSGWSCYHSSLGAAYYLSLDSEIPAVEFGEIFNNQEPSSTVFTVGQSGRVNENGQSYIAYLFAKDTPNVIKCGSYTGAGAGTSVTDVGFTPQWLLVRRTDSTEDWMIFDNKRGVNVGNPAQSAVINPNQTYGERNSDNWNVQFNATGFTFTGPDGGTSAVGGQYVYMAIAEPPAARSMTTEELEDQKLQFATYENRKMVNCGQEAQAARDTLKTALLAAGYTEPEIAAAYVNPDPVAIAINGYYPLYRKESDANEQGNGTSHVHTFDGVTYYMPNGVTMYHGNYSS